VDPQVQWADLVTMDTMELTASLANPEIVDPQLDQLQNWCPNPQSNARAKPHQEMLAHPDPRELMDHPEMEAHQVLMANPEIRDHADHPAHPDHLADPETKEEQEMLAKSTQANPAQLAPQEATANPALQALLAKPVKLAKTVVLVPQALPEMLELEADPARLVLPVVLAMQAKVAHPAVASTAHQLVWLQATKQLRKRLATIIHRQKHDEDLSSSLSVIAFFLFSFHVTNGTILSIACYSISNDVFSVNF